VEVKINELFGAAGVSLMKDGEKVKLVLPDGAFGVIVMSLNGGSNDRSKVSGAVDDNKPDS
jgi:hypothetical protein